MDQARVFLNPPASSQWRQVEHLVCIGIALYGVKKVVEWGPRGLLKRTVGVLLNAGKHIPGVSGVIEQAQDDAIADVRKEILGEGDERANVELPAEGWSREEVLREGRELARGQTAAPSGKGFGGIYYPLDGELHDLHGEMWHLFSATNALYPGVFPAVRKFEAEILSMATKLLGGDDKVCGLLTTGGTESVLLAVKTFRDWARETKGIELGEGEVIAADTAHGCLDKACDYFGLKLIKIPPRASDRRLDPQAVRRRLSSNTVMIYASAPTFPHGVVDPIEELSQVAQEANVALHVDNCLGGVVLSMLKRMGEPIPPFDFDVAGVTSVSMDLHKYGKCSKGASVLAFRDKSLRRFAFHTVRDWSGGLYVTHTMQGSRSGANMATAWATLLYHGEEGYRRSARLVHDLHQRVVHGISRIPGLRMLVQPDACMVPFTSDEFDIYVFASELKRQKGWEIPTMQNPPCANYCVSERLADHVDTFLRDLAEIAQYVREHPEAKAAGQPGAYSTAANLPEEVLDNALRDYSEVLLEVKPRAAGGGGAGSA